MQNGNRTMDRAVQIIKILITTKLQDGKDLTESMNRALKIVLSTIHKALKKTVPTTS